MIGTTGIKIHAAKPVVYGLRRQTRSRRRTTPVMAFRDDEFPVPSSETPSPLRTRGSTKSVVRYRISTPST